MHLGQRFMRIKKIFTDFYYININKMCPLRAWPFVTQGTVFEVESPGPVVEDLSHFPYFAP